MKLAEKVKAVMQWDNQSQTPYFRYTDGAGCLIVSISQKVENVDDIRYKEVFYGEEEIVFPSFAIRYDV